VDAVEAGLRRLGMDDFVAEEDEETEESDVGVTPPPKRGSEGSPKAIASSSLRSPLFDLEQQLPPVPEALSVSTSDTEEEEDLVTLSKSTPQLDPSPKFDLRWNSERERDLEAQNLDWMRSDSTDEVKKRTVIVERLEPVETKAIFSCF